MTSQLPQVGPLPPLSSPELNRLRSRLEAGLMRLDQLTAREMTAANAEPTTQEPAPAKTSRWDDGPSHAAAKVPVDRRAYPRQTSDCRVVVCRLSQEEGHAAPQQLEWRLHASQLKGDLADLSLNGAAVLLPQELSPGETVVLRLSCPRRDTHLDQRAEVVGCQTEAAGRCKVRCRFLNRLSLDQAAPFRRFVSDTGWI